MNIETITKSAHYCHTNTTLYIVTINLFPSNILEEKKRFAEIKIKDLMCESSPQHCT